MASTRLYTENRKNRQPNIDDFPANLKVWPVLLVAAERCGCGGAARLWHIAKHINPGGCGAIPAGSLRRYVLKGLSVKRAVYDAWLKRAELIGLLRRQGEYILITGIARAADLLGVDRINRPVFMNTGSLVRKGWFSYAWAAWLVSHNFTDRPVSRALLREMSGVSERNQRELERRADVKNIANYAVDTEWKADDLQGIRENQRQGAFAYKDFIGWRLPNSRQIEGIKAAPKGSTRRINRRLAAGKVDSLNTVERDPMVRLYCQNDKQFDKTIQKIRRLKNKVTDDLPLIVYLFGSNPHGFGLYSAQYESLQA